ncbi:NUDIX domain-containing protein [Bacterioplanes sanyensis]|nr:NUDIX domain-containing protein [Bacterioplanes sanyensis]
MNTSCPLLNKPKKIFGYQINKEYIPRSAVYGVLVEQGKLVCVRPQHGFLLLPGGGVEAGETLPQALIREFQEECGYRIQPVRALGQCMQYFDSTSTDLSYACTMHFYECKLVQVDNHGEHDVVKVALSDGKALLHQGHQWAVQGYLLQLQNHS